MALRCADDLDQEHDVWLYHSGESVLCFCYSFLIFLARCQMERAILNGNAVRFESE